MSLRRNSNENQTAGATVTAAASAGAAGDTAYTATLGSATLTYYDSSALSMPGTRSILINETGTSDGVAYTGTSDTSGTMRAVVMLLANPSTTEIFMAVRSSAALGSLRFSATRFVQAIDRANVQQWQSASALALNTPYEITLSATKGTSSADGFMAATIRPLYAGSISDSFSTSAADCGTVNVTTFQFGKLTTGGTLNYLMDELAADNGTVTPIAAIPPNVSTSGSGTGTGSATAVPSVATTGTGVGTGAATAVPAAASSGSGTGTGAATAVPNVAAAGTGTGTGSATASTTGGKGRLVRAAASSTFSSTTSGTGTGTGSATVQPVVTTTGSGVGTGTATASPTIATAGTGTGSGSATVAPIVTVTGTGTGTGTATATQNSTDPEHHDVTVTGTGLGTGAAVITDVVQNPVAPPADQGNWRDIDVTFTVLPGRYTFTLLDSPWRFTLEAPVKIDRDADDYVQVLAEAVNTSLDMDPPEVAFTRTTTERPDNWYPTQWSGSIATSRTARALVGPTNGVVALAPGRWIVHARLFDTPTTPTGIAGTLTIV